MMSLSHFTPPPFHSPFWLKGGHAQTLYAKALQAPPPAYRRELRPDSTGQTQVAYDFIDAANPQAPLIVLFHGLEGSSNSHYASALMHTVSQAGFNGVVAHFRSCGGVNNTAPIFYHSGDSFEIGFMLNTLAKRYTQIYAVGVSLGGNALAKYLGEQGEKACCRAAVIVSSPLDLTASAKPFDHGATRLLYTRYFFNSLLPKARATGFASERLAHCRTLRDFDNAFTAPLHGFADAEDYYRRASAKPLLQGITQPTLILNARNDPFVPAASLPQASDVSTAVTLLQPRNGGHVGFVSGSGKGNLNWLPTTILQFFRQCSGLA